MSCEHQRKGTCGYCRMRAPSPPNVPANPLCAAPPAPGREDAGDSNAFGDVLAMRKENAELRAEVGRANDEARRLRAELEEARRQLGQATISGVEQMKETLRERARAEKAEAALADEQTAQQVQRNRANCEFDRLHDELGKAKAALAGMVKREDVVRWLRFIGHGGPADDVEKGWWLRDLPAAAAGPDGGKL